MKAYRYLITYDDDPREFVVLFGPCQSYAPGKWFLSIPWHKEVWYERIYLIEGSLANKAAILQMLHDNTWRNQGFTEIPNDYWCEEYWCPWSEVPILTHQFSQNVTAKYGLLRAGKNQVDDYGDHYWFVKFNTSPHYFLVDKELANPEFLNWFGPVVSTSHPSQNEWWSISRGIQFNVDTPIEKVVHGANFFEMNPTIAVPDDIVSSRKHGKRTRR